MNNCKLKNFLQKSILLFHFLSYFYSMNRRLLVLLTLILLAYSCKKEEEESPPGITFSFSSTYATVLPHTVTFTASSPGAESISWDFGDGSTGQGFGVQHTFAAYGNYLVKASVAKSGLTAVYSRNVPVSFHRRAVIKQLEVLQVPAFKAAGVDWDPGNLPDLSFKLTFPGDTLYETTAVLNNVESGLFNIVPPRGTYVFGDAISIDIYDMDAGNVPDRELMGNVKFKFCDVLPLSPNYTDSVQIGNGALRLKLKFEFQL